MPRGPIRRGQLIAPFGVGALVVLRDGTSVIGCGIDHWYESESWSRDENSLDPAEFEVREWRLEALLGVGSFRLPPDYRTGSRRSSKLNTRLTVPFLRFPQWHFCPRCQLMKEWPLELREKPKCPECQNENFFLTMLQVPIVAMCDHGHIRDFPWREWVHRSSRPPTGCTLRLVATGGASLAAQKVKCETCKLYRPLESVTVADPSGNSTFLSNNLEPSSDNAFQCDGHRPWLGEEEGGGCGRPLRGTLRSASNVYFARVRSAIFLPRGDSNAPAKLVERFSVPPLSTVLTFVKADTPNRVGTLRSMQGPLLKEFSDSQILAALKIVDDEKPEATGKNESDTTDCILDFRRDEFNELLKDEKKNQLSRTVKPIDSYETPLLTDFFEQIVLVDRLRETRVLEGFTRVYPTNDLTRSDLRRLLERAPSRNPEEQWLPAYIVYGEGILFQFKENRLREWVSDNPEVEARIADLRHRFSEMSERRGLGEKEISPRFVMIHTFAHLVMNTLTFECGYSSAALRERLFVSDSEQSPMAGVLIYTAAGDSEGTLGGLVRMGEPRRLDRVVRKAIEGARWCSADPVCMELGRAGGQGPESCNLSACHSCALVPETACEEFNRFIDRALIVGDIGENENLGFFSPALTKSIGAL